MKRIFHTLGLVATSRRKINSGSEYEKYFPKPEKSDPYLTYLGTTYHTLDFMGEIVHKTLPQTAKIAPVLKGATLQETCRNIWNFLYHHYQYKQDDPKKEQLRTPARAWADRHNRQGIDCDCFAISAASMLYNAYKGEVAFAFRKTKYNGKSYFQHVYVVVPKNQQSPNTSLNKRSDYIVIDPVLDKFDYEKPFSEKHDKVMMPIQMLNGFDGLDGKKKGKTVAGKILKKAGKVAKGAGKLAVKGAATPVRNGLLLAFKLNFKRMSERFGYGYLTETEAKEKGLDQGEYAKIKVKLAKLEKTYEKLGGKKENLKKAIVSGWKKGVKKHGKVNGLGTPHGQGQYIQYERFSPNIMRYLSPAMPILNGIDADLGDNNEGLEKLTGLGKASLLKKIVKKAAPIAAGGAVVAVVAAKKAAKKKKAEAAKKQAVQQTAKPVAVSPAPNNKAKKPKTKVGKFIRKAAPVVAATALPGGAVVAAGILAKRAIDKKKANKKAEAAKKNAVVPVTNKAGQTAVLPVQPRNPVTAIKKIVSNVKAKKAAKKADPAKKQEILQTIKENKGNVAKKLKPAKLTPQQASKSGLDPFEHKKLVDAHSSAKDTLQTEYGIEPDEFDDAVEQGSQADDRMHDDASAQNEAAAIEETASEQPEVDEVEDAASDIEAETEDFDAESEDAILEAEDVDISFDDAELETEEEEEVMNGLLGLGVEPVTSTTGIAAASAVIAKILNDLKGVNFNKLLGKKGGQFPDDQEYEGNGGDADIIDVEAEDIGTGTRSTHRTNGLVVPTSNPINTNTLLIGGAVIAGTIFLANSLKSNNPAPAPQPQPIYNLHGVGGGRKKRSKGKKSTPKKAAKTPKSKGNSGSGIATITI